jgi:uncharacterized protein
MTRIIFFLALALIVYLLLKSHRRRGSEGSGANGGQMSAAGEAVVACSRCGVHVPISESVELDGRRYCCSEHAGPG